MADMHYSHHVGHVGHAAQPAATTTSTPRPNTLKTLTNLAGAVASIALIAGVGIWGYKLVVRDVSGIPVVRAAAGEMRVRPEDPGGQLAANTGLAVNEVAAAGTAAAPADRLVLAPQPVELADEDQPMTPELVAPVQQPEALDVAAALEGDATTPQPQPVDVAAALQAGDVDDLVSQLVAGAETIEADAAEDQPVLAALTAPATATAPQPEPAVVIKGPGPKLSLRPQIRPRNSAPAVVVPAAVTTTAPAPTEVAANSLPAGTRLVQLGAFDSADIARAQWDRMQARFGDFLNGKDRVIQKAQSGGRTFYRLRAHGFTDLSDARRFCSALVAEGADCIPVVTR